MTSLMGPTSRRPDISFTANGCITISSRSAKILRLEPGDVVEIVLDSKALYLRRRAHADTLIGLHRGRCYPVSRRGGGSWRLWSVAMSNAVHDHVGSDRSLSMRFACGEPIADNLLPIITQLAL